ncbi:hypothetical protein J132_09217 [Termitomyces sp. J132]|nr:hypothetical protein J132_09217 [Termitomyces sp. J132]
MSETVAQRIIPGAPPPAPLTKSQRKKRKAKKATESTPDSPEAPVDVASSVLTEQAPEAEEVREASTTTAPELQTPAVEEEVVLKPSPIVELIQKRLKATSKKITRISAYASTDPEKLNDDQKRTLKSLPTLEAIQKELGEVKKAIETHESEVAQEQAAKRVEAEKAEKTRITDAVAANEATSMNKFSQILGLLRLRSLLATGQHEPFPESGVVFVAGDILLGDDADIKQSVVSGLLSGKGELEGVSYSHLLEVTETYLHPRVPTPVVEPPVEEAAPTVDNSAPVAGVPATPGTAGFHFMQASELEATSFEHGAEWVERPDGVDQPGEPEVAPASVPEPPELKQEAPNGHVETASPPPPSATIDWAADEDAGLPPIESLHARFGTSGSVTPAVPETPDDLEATPAVQANGHVEAPATAKGEDDGFTQTRGVRGNRGRGHRDGERGGYRGGFRGGFRGGDRGGFRGERGHRGGFRGGDRGFRGGRGEWRGGDGDFRGRGRGRGRGSERGGAPLAPPTTA